MDDLQIIIEERAFGADRSLEHDSDDLGTVHGVRGDTIIVNGVPLSLG